MKVWIDAGHGGRASGACAGARMEKDDTLRCALELERQFAVQGIDTVMTRWTDTYVSLDDRTAMERREKCDLAISCHRNATASKTAHGLEIWLHHAAPQSYINWAKDIADGVQAAGMALRAGQVAPGIYKGYRNSPKADYYTNSGTQSPSCLIELGFIGNDTDNEIFDTKLPELCAAIVRASCKFLGVEYVPENPPEPDKLYRVQVGAFGVKENAERLAAELKSKGYTAIIV